MKNFFPILTLHTFIVMIGFLIISCAGTPSQSGIPLAGSYEKGESELVISGAAPVFEYVYKEKGENKSKGTVTLQDTNVIRLNEQFRWSGSEWTGTTPVSAVYDYIYIANSGQLLLRNGADLPFMAGMWRSGGTSNIQIAQSAETETSNAQTENPPVLWTGGLSSEDENVSFLQIAGTTRVVRFNDQSVNWGADAGRLGILASNDSITNITIPAGRHTLRIRGSNWDNNQKHDSIEQDFEAGQTYVVQIRQYPGHGGFISNASTGEGEEKRIVTMMPMLAVTYFPWNNFYFSDSEKFGDIEVGSNWATMYSLGLNLFNRLSLTFGVQLDDPIIGKLAKLAGTINGKMFGLKFDYQTVKGNYEEKSFEMNNTMVTLFYLWDIGIHNMPVEVGLFWKNSPLIILEEGDENHYGLYAGVDLNGVEHNKDFLFWRMEAGLALTYMYAQTQIGFGHDQYIGKRNAMTLYFGLDAKYESWTSMYSLWSLGPVIKLRAGF